MWCARACARLVIKVWREERAAAHEAKVLFWWDVDLRGLIYLGTDVRGLPRTLLARRGSSAALTPPRGVWAREDGADAHSQLASIAVAHPPNTLLFCLREGWFGVDHTAAVRDGAMTGKDT